MPASLKPSSSLKCGPSCVLTVLSIAILAFGTGLASQEAPPDQARATLLALYDCDIDNNRSTPPGGDMVLLLNSDGRILKKIHGLAISSGCSAFSVSEDGCFFLVHEYPLRRISLYDISKGARLWSLPGLFQAAVFADDLVYAVGPGGIYAIDREGTIVKHLRTGGGIDIAFNPLDKSLWIVGLNIRRYDLDLKLLFKIRLPFSPSNAGAFSVDVNPDGSVWVAGRNAYERDGEGNQLIKISPAGELLKVVRLDFCPWRVRVDKSDGSVWTTGRVRRQDYSRIGDEWPETVAELDKLVEVAVQSHTRKYDSEGRLLLDSAEGGTSIEVDPADGSVWIASDRSILHCSGTGAKLARYTGISDGRKWLAAIP